MRNLKKYIFILLFILPFCLGVAGYCMENENIFDAMYGAFALYMINPVLDCKNILVEIARWTAPVMMANSLIVIFVNAIGRMKSFFSGFFKDAAAIYCDDEFGSILVKNMKHSILVQNEAVKDVSRHIIMFANDEKNLCFYKENEQRFSGKDVYIKLNTADLFRTDHDTAHFFNLNEITARKYWIEKNLIKYYAGSGMELRIAIIGFSQLGQKLFSCGYLNNIYSSDQHIEYHIWGDSTLFRNMHSDIHFMTDDCVVYHDKCWQEEICLITEMDRIIITEHGNTEILSALAEMCSGKEIHCYNPYSRDIDIYNSSEITGFGEYEDILTEENITTDNIYSLAKELNYKYACMYGEAPQKNKEKELDSEWDRLNSFTKGSNIASADYHDIRLMIMQADKTAQIDDRTAEIEHIRWCRYHYLNHWRYGAAPDGKKDSINRLHPCLVAFDHLSRAEKDKDIESIKLLLELKPN